MNPGRLMLNAPPPSEEKAAATIQAHWRGFMVRRTKPLEQLQVIYYVRQDLKGHMTVLADAAMYEKLCSDAQERLRWGECAMALLLRLDAVQGAHADVRDIRKMVTKEVITFQEIVDSTSNDASSGLLANWAECDPSLLMEDVGEDDFFSEFRLHLEAKRLDFHPCQESS